LEDDEDILDADEIENMDITGGDSK